MNSLKLLSVVLAVTLVIGCGGATAGDDSSANVGGTSTGGAAATAGTGVAGNSLGGTSNTGHPSGASSAFIGGATSKGGSLAAGGSISAMGGVGSTGGSKAAGRFTSTGGVVATGAMGAVGGIKGTARSVASGGNAGNAGATGGVTSIAADAGSGCTGSFETIQTGGKGLCVAKLVTIQGPASDAGSSDYSIDVTEVTQGQYNQWLATNPALPTSTDTGCGYKSTGSFQADSICMTSEPVCTGAGCDYHPVVCVDWCDAYAYCAGVGKRLCGAIGGGSNAYESYADATLSQWYRACSSAGTNAYPYGNTYESSYCNCADSGVGATMTVGSLPSCVTSATGYAGVYDLSGNVIEWEDSCEGSGANAPCRLRGGSFVWGSDFTESDNFTCGVDSAENSNYRNESTRAIGFRCCSDEP